MPWIVKQERKQSCRVGLVHQFVGNGDGYKASGGSTGHSKGFFTPEEVFEADFFLMPRWAPSRLFSE